MQMPKLEKFTCSLTGQCNLRCSYCFQRHSASRLNASILERTIDFFYPHFNTRTCRFGFFGGEPLLAFDLIEAGVAQIEALRKRTPKRVTYNMTTNAMLLTSAIETFLERYNFHVMVSYDGLAHDINRGQASGGEVAKAIKRLQQSKAITLAINSVFTPATVHLLAESVEQMISDGVAEIGLSLDCLQPWHKPALSELNRQYARLNRFLNQRDSGKPRPLQQLVVSDSQALFCCSAGKNRMAIDPAGMLWGCFLIGDVFAGREGAEEYGQYCFGHIDEFIAGRAAIYPRVMAHYRELRQDRFFNGRHFCCECSELLHCYLCPAQSAMAAGSTDLTIMPEWYCRLRQTQRALYARHRL
jgi:uncharacterized protein